MANPKLAKLDRSSFIKSMGGRIKVLASGTKDVKPLMWTYRPNQVAGELHPDSQSLTVREIIVHSKDTRSYILGSAKRQRKKVAWFSAGQYLCIALRVGDAELTRPYSISSSPRDSLDGTYMITVKRVDGGLASGYILDNWTVGTQVMASAPLGVFTYEPLRDAKTVVGIAGGSGITPFRSLAKAIYEGDEDCNLVLLYGSRTLDDAVFSDEIAAWAADNARIKLVNVLSEETAPGCESGFITAELIKKYAPEDKPYSVFLCGPQAMYAFVDKELEKLSLRPKFIRHEVFGEYFHPEKDEAYTGDADAEYKITAKVGDREYTVPCKGDTTILRALEGAGIAAPSDCRSGRCGWCRSRLISGEVDIPASVDGRREADRIYGYIHPCCSFPLSDVVVDVPPVPYSKEEGSSLIRRIR